MGVFRLIDFLVHTLVQGGRGVKLKAYRCIQGEGVSEKWDFREYVLYGCSLPFMYLDGPQSSFNLFIIYLQFKKKLTKNCWSKPTKFKKVLVLAQKLKKVTKNFCRKWNLNEHSLPHSMGKGRLKILNGCNWISRKLVERKEHKIRFKMSES